MAVFSDLLPRYQELFAVSDLHLGGEKIGDRNFQIFKYGTRLAGLVRHAAKRPMDRVALVLNGDIIDSLAENNLCGYVALDAGKALAMIERIYDDPSFSEVWDALGEFVQTPGRSLVFVIGNHDIELALPPVQASIRARLAGGEAEADQRIVFATEGGGFACFVGSSRVFCTHGNEVDAWNTIDYSELGRLANAMNAGRLPDPSRWRPNAGTRLVVDLMNEVKRTLPFVDLLKPETQPVLSTLLTINPALIKRIELGDAYAVVRDKIRGDLEVRDLLSAGQELESVPQSTLADSAANELLGAGLAEEVAEKRGRTRENEEDALLLAAEQAIAQPGLASDGVDEDDSTLGWMDIVQGWIGTIDKVEGLRRALGDWLAGDKTFHTGQVDDTYKEVIARVGPEVDFVVTGHTHLARKIEFAPKRVYFNSGTWIRLLRLTPAVLGDEKEFKKLYPKLTSSRMEDLDKARIPGSTGRLPLVLDRTNVVRITESERGTTGELLRVSDGRKKGSVTLKPEPIEVKS